MPQTYKSKTEFGCLGLLTLLSRESRSVRVRCIPPEKNGRASSLCLLILNLPFPKHKYILFIYLFMYLQISRLNMIFCLLPFSLFLGVNHSDLVKSHQRYRLGYHIPPHPTPPPLHGTEVQVVTLFFTQKKVRTLSSDE